MDIQINTPYIKLDQLLKFSGIADDGVMAKDMIKDGICKVNGDIEYRRGRKIYPGDIVLAELEEDIEITVN